MALPLCPVHPQAWTARRVATSGRTVAPPPPCTSTLKVRKMTVRRGRVLRQGSAHNPTERSGNNGQTGSRAWTRQCLRTAPLPLVLPAPPLAISPLLSGRFPPWGGGGWHKALVVGSGSLLACFLRRLLFSMLFRPSDGSPRGGGGGCKSGAHCEGTLVHWAHAEHAPGAFQATF